MNCLVVDDEELARMLMDNYIARLPHLALVGLCANPLDAMPYLQAGKVDLLFLDIQMPEMTGIEFMKTLTQKPKVIFTTAYSQYALEGYELDVIDYLLKPFSFERFVQAVNKAGEREKGQAKEPEVAKDYILVKSEHKLFRIQYQDILYIQSMREYVAFYTPQGRILSLGSLKQLEKDLPLGQFMRIHKSYIIAKGKVAALEGNLLHIGEEKIPIGASYREGVMKALF